MHASEERIAHGATHEEALVAGVDEAARELLHRRGRIEQSLEALGNGGHGAILAVRRRTPRIHLVVSTEHGILSATVAAVGMRCSRVGCSGHAVASFCFDGRAALVWLDPLDPERGMGAGVLCARHADTLTPPRGWHLQDRRTGTPRLWADRPAVVVATATAPPSPEPVLGDERVAARTFAPHTDPLPFDEPAPVSSPPAPADVVDLLDARTPLLARAFAAAGSGPEPQPSDTSQFRARGRPLRRRAKRIAPPPNRCGDEVSAASRVARQERASAAQVPCAAASDE